MGLSLPENRDSKAHVGFVQKPQPDHVRSPRAPAAKTEMRMLATLPRPLNETRDHWPVNKNPDEAFLYRGP